MKLPPLHKLARVYRVEERQVRRWKAAKPPAPLLDVPAMMLWFSSRADMPDHLRNLNEDDQVAMQAEIDALRGEPTPAAAQSKKGGRKIPEPLQGAQHALRRLEEEETRLYVELAAAGGNPVLEAAIRKQWRETLLSLKQYDMLVEAGRRDTGETITRAQMQPVLTAAMVWVRRGIEDAINGASLLLAEADTPQRVYATVAEPCRRSLTGALDAAAGDGKLPGWVREALVSGL